DYAKKAYDEMAKLVGCDDFTKKVKDLNAQIKIPSKLSEIIEDKDKYMAKLKEMATMAKADGCTKTNPIIPDLNQFEELFKKAY
ncbi:MAG: NADPH-dependent butanol dehydrogenase, partial [Oscillospiraceae bacterium]